MKEKNLNLTKMENKEERHKEKKGTMNNLKNGKAMKKTIENVDDRIL